MFAFALHQNGVLAGLQDQMFRDAARRSQYGSAQSWRTWHWTSGPPRRSPNLPSVDLIPCLGGEVEMHPVQPQVTLAEWRREWSASLASQERVPGFTTHTLGESLCPHVSRECPEVTAKITGTLLEMDVPSLQRAYRGHSRQDPQYLRGQVSSTMTVLVCVNKALCSSTLGQGVDVPRGSAPHSGALCAMAVSLNWQEFAQEADATGSLLLATSE